MKIYIVIDNVFFDYGVLGVFSTEEKAKAFIESFSDREGLDYGEFDLDSWWDFANLEWKKI